MTKLLLADDSITIQKVVELVLADEGFEIKSANNGADALSALPAFMPDIVLADIEMPKMNGYQLCEKIKSNSATKHIPVILLTTAFEPIDDELARKVGAIDALIKPFESEDLISKINSALLMSSVEGGEMPEEAEAIEVEAEPVSAMPSEEDLWGSQLEATTAEEAEPVSAFEPLEMEATEVTEAEAAGLGETSAVEYEIAEPEAISEASAEDVMLGAIPLAEVLESPVHVPRPVAIPPPAMPSTSDMMNAFKGIASNQMNEFIKTSKIKEEILDMIAASLKDSVEKILWEVAPNLIEKVANEAMKTSLEHLSRDVEKVIWETVPDLAESIIRKEIEKIKSET